MEIFELLDEQSSINFTGKVNLLYKESDQYLASIYLLNGEIVQSDFRQKKGLKALFRIFYFIHNSEKDLTLILEPEIIPEDIKSFNLTADELKKIIKEFQTNIDFDEKYRPNNDLRITVDPKFLNDKNPLSPEEFEVLCLMCDSERVGEVYTKSDLIEFEITKAFIDLRKKGAIKVLV